MSKKLALFVLVAVMTFVVVQLTGSVALSAPNVSTVHGAVSFGPYVTAFSFGSNGYTEIGTASAQWVMYETLENGTYLQDVEVDGQPGVIVAWQDDSDSSFDKIRIFHPNGANAGQIVLPSGVALTYAQRFTSINGKLFAEVSYNDNAHMLLWENGLFSPPVEVSFPAPVQTVRQFGYSAGTYFVGSGPNGRALLIEDGSIVFEQSTNDNFRSASAVVYDGDAIGEVDGSVFGITDGVFSWLRTSNDISELSGTGYALGTTYSASGTGLVTFDSSGEVYESQRQLDMNIVSAAEDVGVVGNGQSIDFISLINHEVLYTLSLDENVSSVKLSIPDIIVYTTFLPAMLSSAN